VEGDFGRVAGWGLRFPIVIVVSSSGNLVNSASFLCEDVAESGMFEVRFYARKRCRMM
jgi:hypothetical protein